MILNKLTFSITLLFAALFFTLPVKAQVTIGAEEAPHKFSVLELISSQGGLRLSQLTKDEEDSLSQQLLALNETDAEEAKGLVVFNVETECLNFWNGAKWVSLCFDVLPPPPTLKVEPESLTFDYTGVATSPATNNVTVTTNQTEWSIDVSILPDWIAGLSPTSGSGGQSFTFTVSTNPDDAPRTAKIGVTAGELTDTLTITQEELNLGKGTEANPYLILTPEQLDAVRNEPDAYYKVGNNIDLTAYLAPGGAGYAKWGTNGWMPIGDTISSFTGSIDGDKYTVSGLWIQRTTNSTANLGLFGVVNGGTVKNMGVALSIIPGNGSNSINGATTNYIGGLAGSLRGTGSLIKDCYVTGSGMITGSSYIGGVAGAVDGGNLVTGCYTSVNINGTNSTGGVAGLVQVGGGVTNCYSTGSVSGGGSNIGGVAGNVQTGGIINNCYATGTISGTGASSTDVVGGIAGRISQAASRVTNCVALSPRISAAFGTSAGRIVGVIATASAMQNSSNWALSNMVITGGGNASIDTSGAAPNNIHGANIPAGSETSENWWKTGSGLNWNWDTVWTFDTAIGNYPVLQWQVQ